MPPPDPVVDGPRFSEDRLVEIGVSIFCAVGAPEDLATQVVRALVLSNLVGHESHGLVRLPGYVAGIKSGHLRPTAEPRLVSAQRSAAIVDGCWGFGHVAAEFATTIAIDVADEQGVAAVTIQNCHHIGRVGEYVEMIASAGKIGFACCNSGRGVAPYGGNGRVLGTNPIAWSAPLPDGAIVLDIATATLPEGKLLIALHEGRTVAPGVIVDRAGNPSVEPADFYAGGWLLPFVGHKGSGLSMLVELTGGLLSGMGSSCDPDYKNGNGTLIMAIDVAAFVPIETYYQQAATFRQQVKQLASVPDGPDVLLPGEVERRTLEARRAGGVRVQDPIRREFTCLADDLGLDLGDFALR